MPQSSYFNNFQVLCCCYATKHSCGRWGEYSATGKSKSIYIFITNHSDTYVERFLNDICLIYLTALTEAARFIETRYRFRRRKFLLNDVMWLSSLLPLRFADVAKRAIFCWREGECQKFSSLQGSSSWHFFSCFILLILVFYYNDW